MSNKKQSMKKQIEKLIELAKDYQTVGVELNLPMTHNHIRGGHQGTTEWRKEGKLINVYLANEGSTWMVEFDTVSVVGYLGKISMAFDSTEESLQSIYDSAYDYLHNYLLVDVAKIKLKVMKEKQIEIKKLERELKKLKGLV